jgi:hypothetical protein
VVRRIPGIPGVRSRWGDRFHAVCLSIPFAVGLFIGVFGTPVSKADIGIMLSDPTGDGSSRFTEAGHASVYLSNICPVSPLKLRLCAAGEQGSVISNYAHLGENKSYEWNIIPLSIFLYGFDDPLERPLVASLSLKRSLEEQYRKQHLRELCEGPPCSTKLDLNWRDTVATTFVRGVYLFAVHTTAEQDQKFIQYFNERSNVNHYNGFRNNCADFTRRVIDQYFPHAASPDYINDFGMTSPKAVARSFTRYAERRHELGLYITRFAQLPSNRKLTGDARDGTDAMIHQKKWVLPLLALRQYELPVVAVTYVLTARFNPEKEEEKLTRDATAPANTPAALGKKLKNSTDASEPSMPSPALTAEEQWQQYREHFWAIADDAQKCGVDVTHKGISKLLEEVNHRGVFSTDVVGENWMDLAYHGRPVRVGVESSNVLDMQSDVQLAFALQLAKVDRFLLAKQKYRENLKEFRQDWSLLQRLDVTNMDARSVQRASSNQETVGVGSTQGRFVTSIPVSGSEEY